MGKWLSGDTATNDILSELESGSMLIPLREQLCMLRTCSFEVAEKKFLDCSSFIQLFWQTIKIRIYDMLAPFIQTHLNSAI